MNQNIWDSIKKWYVKNGISTAQFFEGNSTECGRDEMLMDFACRAIVKLNLIELQLKAPDVCSCGNCVLDPSSRYNKELNAQKEALA